MIDTLRGRVVDVGCANRWLETKLPPDCEYVGLDYPPTGKELYGAKPDIFADASALPLQEASADSVVILEVLEHLRRPQTALSEIARVLRPNGRMLLTIPFLYPIHDAPHDYQRYTIHGLKREVEAAGMRIDEMRPSLGSLETAGLITSLALGASVVQSLEQRSLGVLLAPFLILAILAVNLLAWLGGRLLPSWSCITVGYALTATKVPNE